MAADTTVSLPNLNAEIAGAEDRAHQVRPKNTLMWIGIGIRVVAAGALGHPYDFEIWRSVVRLYWDFGVNPYSIWSQGPLSLLSLEVFHAPLVLLRTFTNGSWGIVENLMIHAPFIIGDVLVAIAIGRLVGAVAPEWRKRSLAVWACAPGFWWISGGHGQIDPWIPATVLMATFHSTKRRWWLAGIWLGVGFGFKYVPMVLMPGFLLVSWKSDGWRAGWKLSSGFALISSLSMIPVLITSLALGRVRGLALMYSRVAWWSVGSLSDLSPEATLAKAFHSPYPFVLGFLKQGGIANSVPPLLVTGGIIVPFILLGLGLRTTKTRTQLEPLRHAHLLLKYGGVTLLFIGTLSQVAVVQRVYWSLPFALAAAAMARNRNRFVLTLYFSHLLLLPILLVESPLFYLRPPFSFRNVSDIVGRAFLGIGFGISADLALLVGVLLLPVGLLAFYAPSEPSRSRKGLLIGAALLWFFFPLLHPPHRIVFAVATPLGLAGFIFGRSPRGGTITAFPLVVGFAICLFITMLQPWSLQIVQP